MVFRLPVVYAPGGVDYGIPETLRNTVNAVDGLNFDITPALALVKRSGWQQKAVDGLGYGLAVFEAKELLTTTATGFGDFNFGEDEFGSPTSLGFGQISKKLVGLDDVPQIWTTGSFDVTYAGAGAATITIRANTDGSIRVILTEDGSEVLNSNVGDGNEVSPTDMTALKTAVDAVTDFSATITGTATTPAAFLDLRNAKTLTTSVAESVGFGYWAAMNSPITTPLEVTYSKRGGSDFENPSTVSLDGVLYIASGHDNMLKYDDQNLYLAGLPKPSAPSGAVDTGTAAPGGMSGSFRYQIQYKQVDAVNNILEGQISDASGAIDNSAGPYAIDVTIPNLGTTTGYNTSGALTVGTHTSTNVGTSLERINADDGAGGAHTLKAGDTAYLYDKNQAAYAAFPVSAVTTSTITLESSATISVDDNKPISNNLRIEIWRTQAGGSLYYLVDEIPNDISASSQTYSDTTTDANLGALFSTPENTPATPPKCKYAVVWKNQIIMAGNPSDPTKIYYSEFSDVTNPENFPATNEIEIAPQGSAGPITGLAVLAEDLFIFTETATFWGTGNLANDSITINVVSERIGCMAHHTIKEFENNLFFLAKKGVYRVRPGSFRQYQVELVSKPIDPVFREGANNSFRSSYKRAIAEVWPEANKYLLYIPDATTQSGDWYDQSTGRLFAYDIERGQWYPWSNINCLGGMALFDDGNTDARRTIWFHSRQLVSGAVENRLQRFNYTDSEIDYADHVTAISMSYQPQWEFMKSPRTLKLYNEMSIDAFLDNSQLSYTPSGTTTVQIYRDFDDSAAEVSFTFDYIANDKEVIKGLPLSTRRALGTRFSNSTLNKQILINGWTFEGMEYRREMRR